MGDDKVSVKEALEKLHGLSWMVESPAMEYLTDKDGEKIRDYIGIIEDRIDDLETELSSFKEAFGDPFKPCDVTEANQTDIKNGQAMTRELISQVSHNALHALCLRAGVIDPKIVEPISQVVLPNILSEKKIEELALKTVRRMREGEYYVNRKDGIQYSDSLSCKFNWYS